MHCNALFCSVINFIARGAVAGFFSANHGHCRFNVKHGETMNDQAIGDQSPDQTVWQGLIKDTIESASVSGAEAL